MQEVFKYIDSNKRKLVETTKKLVSIKTTNPPAENYGKIVDFIEAYCKKLGLKTRRIETTKSLLKKFGIKDDEKRINLLALWDNKAKRRLHINGHYDVVPVTSNWKTDPFKPVVRQGKLYGRGTEDMKANISSYLMAVEALKIAKKVPKCNIEFSFTPDEETGSATGFKYLVESQAIDPDYAIGEGYSNNFASYGNKGIAWFRIEVLGRSCHSCEPHKGVNSFEKMVKVANELIKLKNVIIKRKTEFNTMTSLDRHATMVMGGELYGSNKKTNIVPDRSVFSVDRRILPEETLADAKSEIVSVIDRLKKKDKDLKVNVKVLAKEPAAVFEGKNPLTETFSKSVKKVLGRTPKFALLAGATDMRFLLRRGVPCIGYSVDGGNTAHSDIEHIKIKSLIETTKVFADLIVNIE